MILALLLGFMAQPHFIGTFARLAVRGGFLLSHFLAVQSAQSYRPSLNSMAGPSSQ